MTEKPTYVAFGEKKLEDNFKSLKQGKFQDKKLFDFISRAITDLKLKPSAGVKIPKKLWPKKYIQNYNIHNLWKYDLPNAWRLVYTIKEDEVMILNIILEWFNHKDYDKRFRY